MLLSLSSSLSRQAVSFNSISYFPLLSAGLDPSRFVLAVAQNEREGKEEIRGFGQMEQKNEDPGEWELRSLVVDKQYR